MASASLFHKRAFAHRGDVGAAGPGVQDPGRPWCRVAEPSPGGKQSPGLEGAKVGARAEERLAGSTPAPCPDSSPPEKQRSVTSTFSQNDDGETNDGEKNVKRLENQVCAQT